MFAFPSLDFIAAFLRHPLPDIRAGADRDKHAPAARHRRGWIFEIAVEVRVVPGPAGGCQGIRVAEGRGGCLAFENPSQIRALAAGAFICVTERALLAE